MAKTGISMGYWDSLEENARQMIQDQQLIGTASQKIVWHPPQGHYGEISPTPIIARCVQEGCRGKTDKRTFVQVGSMEFNTYLCSGCLEDLQNKIRGELGVDA